jgi:L-aminopeptidase/D-esterase-like protein
VVTDAALDKPACFLLGQSAHDGFARALRPAHTRFDGDVAFAVATATAAPAITPNLDLLRLAATDVVTEAIRTSSGRTSSGRTSSGRTSSGRASASDR